MLQEGKERKGKDAGRGRDERGSEGAKGGVGTGLPIG